MGKDSRDELLNQCILIKNPEANESSGVADK